MFPVQSKRLYSAGAGKDCILLVLGRINVIWSGSLIVLFKSSGSLLIPFTEFVSFSSKVILVSHLGKADLTMPHLVHSEGFAVFKGSWSPLNQSSRAPLLGGPFSRCFYQDLLIKGEAWRHFIPPLKQFSCLLLAFPPSSSPSCSVHKMAGNFHSVFSWHWDQDPPAPSSVIYSPRAGLWRKWNSVGVGTLYE